MKPCPKCGLEAEVHAVDGMACMKRQLSAALAKAVDAELALQREREEHRLLRQKVADLIDRMQKSLG